MAPELLNRTSYNGKKVDIFAAGVILFILKMGYPPFLKADKHDEHYKFIVMNKKDIFWSLHEKHNKVSES